MSSAAYSFSCCLSPPYGTDIHQGYSEIAECNSNFKKYLLSNAVVSNISLPICCSFVCRWQCFHLASGESGKYRRANENHFIRKGEVHEDKYILPYAVQKDSREKKYLLYLQVWEGETLSGFLGEQLLISATSTLNQVSMPRHKRVHTEDLRQPGCPARSGAGCGTELCSAYRHPQGQRGAETWHFCSSPRQQLHWLSVSLAVHHTSRNSPTSTTMLPEMIFCLCWFLDG